MRAAVCLAFLLAFAAPFSADAAQKARISGTQTETHVSGAATPPAGDGGVHASGAVTAPADKMPSAKKAKRGDARSAEAQPPKKPSAAGSVPQPRQPKPATVAPPRAPVPPQAPDAPAGK